jgi:hypothetical protein
MIGGLAMSNVQGLAAVQSSRQMFRKGMREDATSQRENVGKLL